jgi:chemotaxis-related protein WspB
MRCLGFTVGARTLAVDLAWVREVCPMVRLRSVPGAPPWLRGLLDYHGTLVPSVDLGLLLGAAPVEPTVGARILLLEGAIDGSLSGRRALFGVLVDRVEAPLTLERDGSWSAPEGLPDLAFIREVATMERQDILVLDAARLAGQHAGLLQGSVTLAIAPGRAP